MKLKPIFTLAIAPFCAVALLACNPGQDTGDGKVQVTFKNYDGTILQSDRIEKGLDTSYKQEVLPSKPVGENEEANIFVGWDNDMTNIKKDTVFTPIFKTIEKGKYIDKDNDGMPEGVDPNDDPDKKGNYFEVTAKSMVHLEQNITIDFSKFLVDNANMKYDNEIAKLGLFMSNPKIEFKDGLFTDKAYGGRNNALYSRLGFDDFHHFDFKDLAANTYTYDPNDTTSGVYGHKYLYDKNGQIAKDLIVIAFEGTNGKRRWSSNFDVGLDDDLYYKKVQRDGEKGSAEDHPEWDNKTYHKGFYVAAKRVLDDKVDGKEPEQGQEDKRKEGPVKFLDYISKHSDHSNGKPIIFVTGHSRGGAMATLVGTYLETQMGENCVPFTYAFAAPSVWGGGSKDEGKPEGRTIFNVLNSDDLVTKVPFSDWGFGKIGDTTLTVSVNDGQDGKLKEAYEENPEGKLYGYIKNADSIFGNLKCGSREEIYTIETDITKTPKYLSDELVRFEKDKKQDAEQKLAEMKKFNEEHLKGFAPFVELVLDDQSSAAEDPHYAIKASCCIGTITAIAQNIMTENQSFIDNAETWLPYLNNDYFLQFGFDLVREIVTNILYGLGAGDAIALPHDYGAYHIILREYQEPKNK